MALEEDAREYEIHQSIENATKQSISDDNYDAEIDKSQSREDFESDLDLKAKIIDPESRAINKFLNVSDIVLGNLSAKEMIMAKFYAEISDACMLSNFPLSSKISSAICNTANNISRSKDGFQQKMLISRIKQSNVAIGDNKKEGVVDKLRK